MIFLPRKIDEINVLTKESKWLLTTFLVLIIINSARPETECPSYKPYKTDAGCVAKCPQDFVINGSSCNITCGSWYTDENRVCQPECTKNYFIKKQLRAIGWYPYLEKQCIQSCAQSELVFNRTCVEACPEGFTYFVNDSCLEKCPNEFSYLINVTKGNNILHHKCTKTCPYLENNNYCVSSCPVGKRQLNLHCVNNCPQTYKFMDGNRCLEQCPFERKFHSNKNCVSTCPSHLPVLHNTSCVANCSKDFMFVDKLIDGSKMCVNVCGKENKNQFVLNNECVPKCPRLTFNGTCLEECPNQSLIINNVTMGRNCIFGNICSELFYYDACVGKCPNEKYFLVHQNMCVDMCPVNTELANKTCLQSCDDISPYVEKTYVDYFIWSTMYKYTDRQHRKVWKKDYVKTSVLKCVENCSNETLYFNYTCVDNCPMETELSNSFEAPWNLTSVYIRNGGTCVRECPIDKQFIVRHYVKDTVNSYLICMVNCPENTYILRNMCLSHCPEFMFNDGGYCVNKCPRSRHLLKELTLTIYSTVKRQSTKISMFQCVATCDTEFISNNMCVKFCPEKNPYIDRTYCHNNTCGKLYEQYTSKGIMCVPECPNGMVINFNKCSTSCSKEAVLHQKRCLRTCPPSSPLIVNTAEDLLFSTHEQISKFRCLSRCEELLLYQKDKQKCIFFFNCKYPYTEHDGQCLKHCPKGYKWFNGCFNVTATIISLIILSVLTCLCFVSCRVLLIETIDFVGICRQYTQHDKNVIKPNILLLHMKKEGMEVRVVSEDTPSEVCLDTLSLHLADESHINKCFEEETNVQQP